MALAVLEKFAASFVSLAVSVASLGSEGGVKPTRITLRSLTLYSAASLAFFFLWVWVSNQKHLRCASVFALAWRSCSSAHLLAVVFEPSGASDGWGFVRYATYLRTARPPRPPLPSPSPTSTSSSSTSSRRRLFFPPGRNSSVCFNEGVLTWSFKASQVMGGRLDEHNFA